MREITYMRVSVTDRCNLQCKYCMPKAGGEFAPEKELLSFEEMEQVIKAASEVGINKIKITGGEPLVREGVTEFIGRIAKLPKIKEVTITTNGVLLKRYAKELKEAGVSCVNVNLPSLKRERYAEITRGDCFLEVMDGIHAAEREGLRIKLNCVILSDLSVEEIMEYAALAKEKNIAVRFIEMMPIGLGGRFPYCPSGRIKKMLEARFGDAILSEKKLGNGPAVYYTFSGFRGDIGFIDAMSRKFCSYCNRIRLTVTGDVKLCLNYDYGCNVKKSLGDEERLIELLRKTIYKKPRQHQFNGIINEHKEERKMNQIGG